MEQKIKVRFKGYDDKLLDKTIGEIIHTVRRTGAEIVGPIPLPVVPIFWRPLFCSIAISRSR